MKNFEALTRTPAGSNARSFAALPSYGYWIQCDRTNMMKWWKAMLARFLACYQRSLTWTNILASYLRIFERPVHSCGIMKFYLPQKVAPAEIKANFEKACRKIEPLLKDRNENELTSSTLLSMSLNYFQRTSPSTSKTPVDPLQGI